MGSGKMARLYLTASRSGSFGFLSLFVLVSSFFRGEAKAPVQGECVCVVSRQTTQSQ